MRVLALSGWVQYAQSLDSVLPDDAVKIAYGDCSSVEAVFKRMKEAEMPQPDVAVGWSLGGQLLARAVAAGVIAPKRLVLLGAAYQLVSDKHFSGGKSKMVIGATRLALQANMSATLKQFQVESLAQGDSHSEFIRATAPQFLNLDEENDWLFWFDELARFSCRTLDFSGFPRTSIVHGQNDPVIPYANAIEFNKRIDAATLHSLPNCGHAPHWHDANFVKSIITES